MDYDLDGDPDLYVSNDGTPNLLLANDGQGHFKDVGLQAGAAFNQFGEAAGSMGAAVGDCNGDGLPDLFVTRFGNASLYLNSRGGFFEDRIQASGILDVSSKYTGWGGNFLDFDNDGDLDLFIANGDAHFLKGMPALLLENQRRRAASRTPRPEAGRSSNTQSTPAAAACSTSTTTAAGLCSRTLGGRAVLLRNRGSRPGATGSRLNSRAPAATATASAPRCGSPRAAGCSTPRRAVPPATSFSRIPGCTSAWPARPQPIGFEIRWPSGQTQVLTNVPADQTLLVREKH